ncbi:hypothetical protein E4L96_06860 [Massilia arenosa]|uniref:Peptidase M13 N-terminal domain-containing protein n=1 Tax=Zemynaea arenosa TaxID=2561931 RepID=A0A4Y9SGV0_9BURK|nr:hypothetical protein [Massilia arenosa]TFW23277.1 hypothetical protein E4L96_06860 [Massilia arenosa]
MHTQHLSAHGLARVATVLALALSATAALAQPAPAPSPAPILQSVLDPAVNACDDFYRRACGGFIASTKLTPGRPSVDLANQQFEANLEHSFQKLFARDVSHDPELARLKTFYTSCMANTPADIALVKDWLARIDAAQTPARIQDLVLELSSIGVEPFFTYTGQPDRLQWDRYRGEIHNAFIWANAETVLRSFRAAGLPEDQAQRDAATVVAMVTALRKARGDRYDPSTAENPRTPAALAQLAPSVDWKRYLHMVGAPADRNVNVTAPGFLTAVEKELVTRTPAELRAYLRWMYLFSLRGELPAPYSAPFGDLGPNLRVQLENPAGRCRDATVRAMGVEFSRQYATRVLGMPARDAAPQDRRRNQDPSRGLGGRCAVAVPGGPRRHHPQAAAGRPEDRLPRPVACRRPLCAGRPRLPGQRAGGAALRTAARMVAPRHAAQPRRVGDDREPLGRRRHGGRAAGGAERLSRCVLEFGDHDRGLPGRPTLRWRRGARTELRDLRLGIRA